MGITEKYIITISFTKNEYFSTEKKTPVPKNQSFNTSNYLTSKNRKRSMNTTLLDNNNLNDENSKTKTEADKNSPS